jgi:cysteine dioxygenase
MMMMAEISEPVAAAAVPVASERAGCGGTTTGSCAVRSPLKTVVTFQDLIDELRRVFERDEVDVDYVKELLASYKSNPKEWGKFAIFDQYRYTRNLVDTGNGKYNLIALCWGEGQGSSVHDHSDAHCFVKVLDGALKETMFEWPAGADDATIAEDGDETGACGRRTRLSKRHENGEGLTETGVSMFDKDAVTYINDEMGIHRVENPSHSNPAVSLHLYSPPFDFCRTFDQRTGKSNRVKMVYWSKFGQRNSTVDKTVNGCSQVVMKPTSDVASAVVDTK